MTDEGSTKRKRRMNTQTNKQIHKSNRKKENIQIKNEQGMKVWKLFADPSYILHLNDLIVLQYHIKRVTLYLRC